MTAGSIGYFMILSEAKDLSVCRTDPLLRFRMTVIIDVSELSTYSSSLV